MDRLKTGLFLKELRSERGFTQEQLAELLGVSNRSVSRWETGANLPDLDLLIQISKIFDVELGELVDGERKNDNMDKKTEETLLKAADYANSENEMMFKKLHWVFLFAFIAMMIYAIFDILGLSGEPYNTIGSVALGFATGIILTGFLYSGRHITKLKAAKMRLFQRLFKRDETK